MKKIIKNTLILFAITLIAGALLAIVYNVTKDPISEAEKTAEKQAYLAVSGGFEEFEDFGEKADGDDGITVEAPKKILNGSGEVVGYAVKVTTGNGYGGDIQLVIGTDTQLKITGMKVISASNESPGLGANCMNPEFQERFIGKTSGIELVKGGAKDNQVDALSSATITSTAVTNAVNAALEALERNITGGDAQ